MEKILGQILDELKGIKTKLDSVEDRVTSVETRLTSVEARLISVEARQDEMYQVMLAIEHRTEVMKGTFDSQDNKIVHLQGDMASLRLTRERDQTYILTKLARCEKEIHDLKQHVGLS